MSSSQKWALLILRLTLGWMMLYAGWVKIISGTFSAAGYLNNASTFSGFYKWLASESLIGPVSFINEWALLLLGVSLILGIGVRLSATLGAVLMLFYYFPVLKFPYPNAHSYIVDEHIIYAAGLLILAAFRAGRIWGLDPKLGSRIG